MFDWRDKDDDETVSIPVELRIKVKEFNLKGLIGIRRMKNQYPSLLNHIENQTILINEEPVRAWTIELRGPQENLF